MNLVDRYVRATQDLRQYRAGTNYTAGNASVYERELIKEVMKLWEEMLEDQQLEADRMVRTLPR